MDTFEISSYIDGELVVLRVSYLGNFPDPNYRYFRVSNGDILLSIIKIDGSCEVEVDSGEIDEESFVTICKAIRQRTE